MHTGNYGGKKPTPGMKAAALAMHEKHEKNGEKNHKMEAMKKAAKGMISKKSGGC